MSSHSLFPPVNDPRTTAPEQFPFQLENEHHTVFRGVATPGQRLSVHSMPNLTALVQTEPVVGPDGQRVEGQETVTTIPFPHVAIIDVYTRISDEQSVLLRGSRLVVSRTDADNTLVPLQAIRFLRAVQGHDVDANDWLDTIEHSIYVTDDGVLRHDRNQAPERTAAIYVLDQTMSGVDIVMDLSHRSQTGAAPVTTFPHNPEMADDGVPQLPDHQIVAGRLVLSAIPEGVTNIEGVGFSIEGPSDPRANSFVSHIRAYTTGHMVSESMLDFDHTSRSSVRATYKRVLKGGGSHQDTVAAEAASHGHPVAAEDSGELSGTVADLAAARQGSNQDDIASAGLRLVAEVEPRGRRRARG